MGEDTKYCGNCKREVSASNFTVHTVHCQRNIAVCTLCGEAVPRSHYQQHVEANHKEVACPKCGAQVEPLRTFAHEKEECPRRQVACPLCELEVPAAELPRHEEYCGSRTERCKGCSKYVQIKHLQFHYENDHKYLRPEEKAEQNGSDDEGTEECPICLGPVTLPLALECGHTFCMVCVKGIANTTKNCAICRRDIPRDMLMDIRFCREEDIIKHYVNKPRNKKNTRSHSVPNRNSSYTSGTSSSRRLVHHTTQEYDDMVSALLSSRTSSTSYRYQRPSNTHTPPSYTPYSSSGTSNSTTTNTTTSSSSCQESCSDSCKDSEDLNNRDDDCCCSSSSSSSPSSSTTTASTSTSTSTTTSSSPPSTCKPSDAPPLTAATTTTTTTSSSPKKGAPASARPASGSQASSTKTVSSVTTRSTATTTVQSSSSTTTSSSSSSASSSSTTTTTTTTTTTPSSPYSNGARPRRPTSLAVETISVLSELSNSVTSATSSASGGSSRSGTPKKTEPPKNATQEEYDRWLAFQLAKSEDDLPPAEFNRKHRPTFRRSLSMPERAGTSSDTSSSSDSEDSDTPSSRRSSRRPPASPRNTTASSSSSSSSSAFSSSNRSTPISKSSSDSSAATGSSSSSNSSSSSSVLSTGARPKNTSLRKRVSFKEDTPPLRREAPVMLPCEFCDEMFSERDLMRHQTSCEQNETQLPRTSRLAQRSAAAAAATSSSISSSSSSSSSTTVSSTTATTTSSTARNPGAATPTPRRTTGRTPTPVCTPPRKSVSSNPASIPPKPSSDPGCSHKSPAPVPPRNPASPSRGSPTPGSRRSATSSPLPRCPPSASPPPVASPVTTTITIVDKPPCVVVSPSLGSGSNRPFSVSPAPIGSTSNSSVSSSSVSTTPSTSSSTSPVPAATPNRDSSYPNTPTTDVEMDYDDEEGPYMRPRRGRLLSSAIFSWRSISASGAAGRRGYVRSNTAPLEDTSVGEETQPSQPVTTSRSATQLPASHSPGPEAPASPEHAKGPQMKQISPTPKAAPVQDHAEPVFIKNPNKYRAPPPPPPPPPSPPPPDHRQKPSSTPSTSHSLTNGHKSPPPQETPPGKTVTSQEKPQVNGHVNGFIKLDSKPMMNGHISKEVEELIPCEFCKQVYPPNKFQSHQTMCEATRRPPVLRATSPMDNSNTQKTKGSIPAKHNKGPAPPPPEDASQDTRKAPASEAQRAFSPARHRMERSQSVLDDRISYSEKVRVQRRLERASSISRSYYTSSSSPARRWNSREVLHSNGLESSASYASSGWSGSTSSVLCGSSGYTGSHGWSSHLGMVRDDVRSRAAAATAAVAAASAAYYDNEGDSDHGEGGEIDQERVRAQSTSETNSNSSSSSSSTPALAELQGELSLNYTAAHHGGMRYRERSTSRPRPSSMYSTSDTWGSLFDLHSPSRQYNISDAFSSASFACKKRYIR